MKKTLNDLWLKSDFLTGLLIAGIVSVFTVGCIHLSIGIDRDRIPDKIVEKFFSNEEAHPTIYVESEKQAIFRDLDEEGFPVYKEKEFSLRYSTKKEEELQLEIDLLKHKVLEIQNKLTKEEGLNQNKTRLILYFLDMYKIFNNLELDKDSKQFDAQFRTYWVDYLNGQADYLLSI